MFRQGGEFTRGGVEKAKASVGRENLFENFPVTASGYGEVFMGNFGVRG